MLASANPQVTIDQHYVPRSYLKRFTYDDHRVYYFDKFSGRHGNANIKSVAQRDYFYDIPKALLPAAIEDTQIVEHALCELENLLKPTLDGLIETVEANGISQEQREALSFFMALQMTRTLGFRHGMSQLFADSGQRLKDILTFETFVGPVPDLSHLTGLQNETLQTWHGKLLLEWFQLAELSAPLLDQIWYVGLNATEEAFYTSDEPVLNLSSVPATYTNSGGLSAYGTEVLYPLTPTHILIVRDSEYYHQDFTFDGGVKRLRLDEVEDYNAQQLAHCHQYVYSKFNDFRVAKAACQERPDVCDPKREAFPLPEKANHNRT